MIQKSNTCSVCSPTNVTSYSFTDEDEYTVSGTQSYVCEVCQTVLEELKPRKASNKMHYMQYPRLKHHNRFAVQKLRPVNHIKFVLTEYRPRSNI